MEILTMCYVLNAEEINRLIVSLAEEIKDKLPQNQEIAFLGIQPRGIHFGQQIFDYIKKNYPQYNIQYGTVDITLYRDDLYEHLSIPHHTTIPFNLHQKTICLFDDVLFTGRTIRAALEALNNFGRPNQVLLCVLIDRSQFRQLPIQANFVGKILDVLPEQKIEVNIDENKSKHFVKLVERKEHA